MVSLVAWQTRELSYSSKVPISVSWENLSLLIIFNLIQIKFIEIRLNQGQFFFFPTWEIYSYKDSTGASLQEPVVKYSGILRAIC